MKKTKKNILYFRLLRPIAHFVLIVLAFYLIFKLRFRTDLIPFIQLKIPAMDFTETMIFSLLAGLIVVFMGFLNGIYELFKPIHGYYRKFLNGFFVGVILTSFISYIGYGFVFTSGISRFVLFVGFLFSLIFLTLFDIIFNSINADFEKKTPYKLVFLYTNRDFFEKIRKNFGFYKIYKIWGISVDELGNEFEETLSGYDIIITLGIVDNGFMQDIADYARLHEKTFYHISQGYFLDDLIYNPTRIGPILALEYKPSPLDGWFRVAKRIFDILSALAFLILFWWIYLLVALFIYIKDGKPIFYKSIRVGKGGGIFNMYKFRTMVKDAENIKKELISKNERKGPLFKLKNDPRIPKWGKFLRKTSLDEIPQIFNILKGEMSLVGPRPHLPEEVEQYTGWQKRLLSIKPGLTGYAQIFGRDKLDFEQEAKLDLYYIQNRSLFLDVYVVITTLRVVFKGK